jgi:hypothetical protein
LNQNSKLEDELTLITKIDPELLLKKPFVKLFASEVVDDEQILLSCQTNDQSLIAMARFILAKKAVLKLKSVPKCIEKYISYGNPS